MTAAVGAIVGAALPAVFSRLGYAVCHARNGASPKPPDALCKSPCPNTLSAVVHSGDIWLAATAGVQITVLLGIAPVTEGGHPCPPNETWPIGRVSVVMEYDGKINALAVRIALNSALVVMVAIVTAGSIVATFTSTNALDVKTSVVGTVIPLATSGIAVAMDVAITVVGTVAPKASAFSGTN